MYVDNGTLLRRYEQQHRDGMYLGRHLELDSRSTAYGISVDAQAVTPKPQDWPAGIPILDQGQLGSCTGNAGTRFVAWLHRNDLASVKLENFVLNGDPSNDENFAVELYHDATVNDGFSGTYPPDDTGSSGLGVMRSLKKAGLVSNYIHAFSLRGLVAMLQHGPFIQGMPWYNAFFEPDSNGFIDHDPNWQASGVAGGHEIYARGVDLMQGWNYTIAPEKIILTYDNSWNTSFGDNGSFRIKGSTYVALKAEMDIMQGRL